MNTFVPARAVQDRATAQIVNGFGSVCFRANSF